MGNQENKKEEKDDITEEINKIKRMDELKVYKKIIDRLEKDGRVSGELSVVILTKLNFYINSANKGNKYFHKLSKVIIVLGLFISLLSSRGDSCIDFIITFLSLLVTAISSIMSLVDYKTRWQRYRILAEKMEKEIRIFSNDKDINTSEFVKKIEEIIADDVGKFSNYLEKKNI